MPEFYDTHAHLDYPDFAQDLMSGLSKKAGLKGVTYEVDAVLLTYFSGGGLSFTVKF